MGKKSSAKAKRRLVAKMVANGHQAMPLPPDDKRPNLGMLANILSLVLALFIPLLQANGVVDVNWQFSIAIYAVLIGISLWSMLTHGVPHFGKLSRYLISVVFAMLIGGVAVYATRKQYQREQARITVSSAVPIPPRPTPVPYPKPLTQQQLEDAVRKALPPVDHAKADFDLYARRLISDDFDFQEDLRLVPRESLFNRDPIARWHELYPRAKQIRDRFARIPGMPMRNEVVDRLTARMDTLTKVDDLFNILSAFNELETKLIRLTGAPRPGVVVSHSDHTDVTDMIGNDGIFVSNSNHTKVKKNTVPPVQ